MVFTHEIRTVSGKHRHQGGLIIYVIDGKGYSVVDGERVDWQKRPVWCCCRCAEGVRASACFNSQPGTPAVWMAFIKENMQEYVASEMTQTEVSPEYKQATEGR